MATALVPLTRPVARMLPLALAKEKTAPAMGVSVGSVVDVLVNVTGTRHQRLFARYQG